MRKRTVQLSDISSDTSHMIHIHSNLFPLHSFLSLYSPLIFLSIFTLAFLSLHSSHSLYLDTYTPVSRYTLPTHSISTHILQLSLPLPSNYLDTFTPVSPTLFPNYLDTYTPTLLHSSHQLSRHIYSRFSLHSSSNSRHISPTSRYLFPLLSRHIYSRFSSSSQLTLSRHISSNFSLHSSLNSISLYTPTSLYTLPTPLSRHSSSNSLSSLYTLLQLSVPPFSLFFTLSRIFLSILTLLFPSISLTFPFFAYSSFTVTFFSLSPYLIVSRYNLPINSSRHISPVSRTLFPKSSISTWKFKLELKRSALLYLDTHKINLNKSLKIPFHPVSSG
ncbi:unnamed protein product [Acanthosepion pharaonis]|uniref:Uncharacterized protein n=1 Tax=Acanthosepion pharaonis TaxID=158019 RepID=A0A812CDF3_ACAPH|nr:unnamed protein product [Sepia pharaonis]